MGSSKRQRRRFSRTKASPGCRPQKPLLRAPPSRAYLMRKEGDLPGNPVPGACRRIDEAPEGVAKAAPFVVFARLHGDVR